MSVRTACADRFRTGKLPRTSSTEHKKIQIWYETLYTLHSDSCRLLHVLPHHSGRAADGIRQHATRQHNTADGIRQHAPQQRRAADSRRHPAASTTTTRSGRQHSSAHNTTAQYSRQQAATADDRHRPPDPRTGCQHGAADLRHRKSMDPARLHGIRSLQFHPDQDTACRHGR